jgi:16S rRNA G966 N2-methylase RsmD/disulfide oxidoreductase YuzD
MAVKTTTTAERTMTAEEATIDNAKLTIRFHPEYEKIVPKLKPEEYQELKSSIAENGLYYPIIINKDGFILDGHHRFKACNELGILKLKETTKFEVKSFDSKYSERIFVIDTNLTRRQLEPYSRVELVLLKKEEHLKLGKQRMSESGEKGNGIRWNDNDSHEQQQQHEQQECYDDDIPSSTAISLSRKEEEEGNNNYNNNDKNIGFIEIDKPDNITGPPPPPPQSYSSSSFSSYSSFSPFNTQKQLAQESQVSPSTFYEAEYIAKKGSAEQKQKLRYGQAKIHTAYTMLKQRERLEEVNAKIQSGVMLSDKDILNKLKIPIMFSDVWNFRQLVIEDDDEKWFGQKDYPGKTFAQLIFNTLYFFTEKGDLIVDPMAGGGVVGDACKVMGRKCYMYDVNPVRKDVIVKHDLVVRKKQQLQQQQQSQGLAVVIVVLPKQAKNADLIFWDPPYYKKKKEEYGPQSISSLPRKKYLEVFEAAAKAFAQKGVKKVALLMSNYDDNDDDDVCKYNNNDNHNKRQHPARAAEEQEEEEEENNDSLFIHHYINQFEKTGKWRVFRIIDCPFSSKKISAPIATHCLKSKKMARLSRYLVVFVRK